MKPSTIKIDDVTYVREDAAVPTVKGDYAVVRCHKAGVHAGYVTKREGGILTLANSRRLWRWSSTAALSALAIDGPYVGNGADNRFERVVPRLDLTDGDVCEVLYCTDEARAAIQATPVWVAR